MTDDTKPADDWPAECHEAADIARGMLEAAREAGQ